MAMQLREEILLVTADAVALRSKSEGALRGEVSAVRPLLTPVGLETLLIGSDWAD